MTLPPSLITVILPRNRRIQVRASISTSAFWMASSTTMGLAGEQQPNKRQPRPRTDPPGKPRILARRLSASTAPTPGRCPNAESGAGLIPDSRRSQRPGARAPDSFAVFLAFCWWASRSNTMRAQGAMS